MLRLARERPELRVVADQHGNPTYAPHLAEAILDIAAHLAKDRTAADRWGIYHAVAAGETTLARLRRGDRRQRRRRLGVPPVPVIPITTARVPDTSQASGQLSPRLQ